MPNLSQKLISAKLAGSRENRRQEFPAPGEEIQLHVDQTLTQDATGTLVMLELAAMGVDRVQTEVSVQYVDHNLLAQDSKNPDDHLFLQSACQRLGIWYSRPGNGVSHPIHMQRFAKPGKMLLGSDSHTCANGAMGMLAVGTGGFDVTLAMMGKPATLNMPEVFGIELRGELPAWVSAKDIILEMLRRHGVRGGKGCILEYYGAGLKHLDVWDRHVIANMGAELGATTTVFPADEAVHEFLRREGRENDFTAGKRDSDARYDRQDVIDLSELVPLIAKPGSPGNVVAVDEVAGERIYQAYIGSSANPGFRDFAVAARMVEGRKIPEQVSFDINPTSSRLLRELVQSGDMARLLESGARFHQPGCNGCIGMGQAPATGRNSLRTVPRNFPGRSGTTEDSVWLCSPETATASALNGAITDPRTHAAQAPRITAPKGLKVVTDGLSEPPPRQQAQSIEMVGGPNIKALPDLEPVAGAEDMRLPVLLKLPDDVSTDEILPAGARVLPFRSNIEEISKFCFESVDASYVERAQSVPQHAIVAGNNYGQGSSREHAALAPRYLGLALVVAKNFSRIHLKNLVNFGVVPAEFSRDEDYDAVEQGSEISVENLADQLKQGSGLKFTVLDPTTCETQQLELQLPLSAFDREVILAGGRIAYERERGANS